MIRDVLFRDEFNTEPEALTEKITSGKMGRSVDAAIAGLPKARRGRIETKAARLAREMIGHADSMNEIHKAMSKTRIAIARELGIGQVAVAQLENRTDLLLSTLQRYVRAAGAELFLVIHTKQGEEIVLQGLGDLGGKENATAKLRRVTGARSGKRRTML